MLTFPDFRFHSAYDLMPIRKALKMHPGADSVVDVLQAALECAQF